MWRRLRQILVLVLALLVGLALLGPLFISRQPLAPVPSDLPGLGQGDASVRIPFPGTAGIDLHYRERAAGDAAAAPTFVLLHGFTFNLATWDRVLERFAGEGRAVAYDQIPYGLSAKLHRGEWTGPNPYAKEAAIEQLFSFLDARDIDRATLVGNSSGGTLAMEAALADPGRVAGLILVAPWVYAQRPTLPAWLAETPQLRRLSLLIARKLGEGVLLDYAYAEPARIGEARREWMRAHARIAGWDLAWGELLSRSLYSPVEVSAWLQDIEQPVLLVAGDTDRLVPVADTERVAAELPDATLRILEGCGHVPQEECPEEFWRAVSEWLTGQGLPSAGPAPPAALSRPLRPASVASRH
jgi:pimeloyl-ACP methyl ester carboxylesterase